MRTGKAILSERNRRNLKAFQKSRLGQMLAENVCIFSCLLSECSFSSGIDMQLFLRFILDFSIWSRTIYNNIYDLLFLHS
jgi:hypothetical protein